MSPWHLLCHDRLADFLLLGVNFVHRVGKGWKRMEKELKSTYEELHPEAIPLAAHDRNEGTVNYILIHFRPPACGDYFGSFLDLTCRLWTVDCGRLRCLVLPSWQETESPVTASLMFEV